ncbi:MAG: nitric-oxide reductase large subunit, partial [Arenimonas sp.]|nr:nitric-oxide reductase large subunit [Arenimonas sp.]
MTQHHWSHAMETTRKLWIGLITLLCVGFAVLLWMGGEIYRHQPPIPESIQTESGQVIYTRSDIETGRTVWQSFGGQQLGSIWGHGALVAPDWSADWLHRESMAWLSIRSQQQFGKAYENLSAGDQAKLSAELRPDIRANTYDEKTQVLTISDERALAISQVAAHYESLFSNDPATADLRETYAMKDGTVDSMEHRRQLSAFFYWTAWAAVTNRPNQTTSYTNNWPYDPIVGNQATSSTFLWTVFSVLFMIAGIGLLAWHYAVYHGKEGPLTPPTTDPLRGIVATPSMKATAKYFWLVLALFLVQILLGATTAHFQVEGQYFYGFKLAEILPYSLTRSWHTQLAVLWIATAWLA